MAFHFVLAHGRHSLHSVLEQTSDTERGLWSYYTDNYLVQFDERHFLMGSLREKSSNDVVLLTSKLIQNVARVTQGLVWTARCLSSYGQSEILTEGGSCWERSDPQKRVKTRQRRGQLHRSLLPSLSAHTECGLHAYKAMEVWRAELLNCFDAVPQPLSAQLSVCHHLWKVGLLTITSLQLQIQWNPKKESRRTPFMWSHL